MSAALFSANESDLRTARTLQIEDIFNLSLCNDPLQNFVLWDNI